MSSRRIQAMAQLIESIETDSHMAIGCFPGAMSAAMQRIYDRIRAYRQDFQASGEAVQAPTPKGTDTATGEDERIDRFLRVIVAVRQICGNAIVQASRKKFDKGMTYLAERILREIRETNKTSPAPDPKGAGTQGQGEPLP